MLRSALIVVLATAACRAEPTARQETSGGDRPESERRSAGRVIDRADVLLPAEEHRLAKASDALQQATSDQLVIVTVPTLGQESMEHLSWALGSGLGLGAKGADNGVLMVVAPKEKRVRIAVGKGLEGLLTEARSADVVRLMMPALDAGRPAQAIGIGQDRIAALLRSNTRRPQRKAA